MNGVDLKWVSMKNMLPSSVEFNGEVDAHMASEILPSPLKLQFE